VKSVLTLANSLSLFRLLITPVIAWTMLSNLWLFAGCLLILAIISDLIDGPIARRNSQESSLGGLLDHSCDAILVAVLLFILNITHDIPLILPILVLASFLQYVLDSKALAGHNLRTSFLGRSNGIAYYVLTSLCVFSSSISFVQLGQFLIICSWILVISTLISMSERLWTLLGD
tara:strand:- start:2874 stop:3398 length:525 start_codon:yes stop_codon:yes gene_type:complete